VISPTQGTNLDNSGQWDDDEDEEEDWERCRECGATMPGFAMAAHARFHDTAE